MLKFEKRISVDGEKALRRAEMDRAAEELRIFLQEAIERSEKLKELWEKELEESRVWLERRIETEPEEDLEYRRKVDELSMAYASLQRENLERQILHLRESYAHFAQSGFFSPFAFDDAVEKAKKKGVFVESDNEFSKH